MLGPHIERAVCDPQQLQSFRNERSRIVCKTVRIRSDQKNWNHDREKFRFGIKDFLPETGSDSDSWQLRIRPPTVRLTAKAGPAHRVSRILICYRYSRLATHQSRIRLLRSFSELKKYSSNKPTGQRTCKTILETIEKCLRTF
jgi:hypothetical protein